MGDPTRVDDLYFGQEISPARLAFDRAFRSAARKAVVWLLHHWLMVANLSNAATFAGALLTPFMMARGWLGPAQVLFGLYSLICAQNPARSYFLFGYQAAIDQRMLAIYVSATLAGLAYAGVRHRLPGLPWRIYLVLIAPIALDGFTQLFGWRASNWQLRTITGVLFGIASVWWLYPILERALAKWRRALAIRYASGEISREQHEQAPRDLRGGL